MASRSSRMDRAGGVRARQALDAVERALRKPILDRYARLTTSGKPVTCQPRADERNGTGPSRGSKYPKVIFDLEAAALAAARELVRAGCRPMTAYPCPRSRRGHWHLKTIRQIDADQ